jgi:hypothetical protein
MSFYGDFKAQHFGTPMTDAEWRVELMDWVARHPTEAGEELAQHMDDDLVAKLVSAPEEFARDCVEILKSHIIVMASRADDA